MTPEQLDAWMLVYVDKRGVVMGWDWEADLAFAEAAEFLEETIKMIRDNLRNGQGISMYVVYHRPTWQGVKAARIRVLKRLTTAGKLCAHWAGMPSSVTGGATRTRAWKLPEA